MVNEPVHTHEVRDYLAFQKIKKEQEAQKQKEVRKSDESPTVVRQHTKLASTLNSDRTTGKNNQMNTLDS